MISQTVSPSPGSDITEFLFPTLEPGSSTTQWKHDEFVDLDDLNALSHTDLMADIDFCEVFTDIQNLLLMDGSRLIQTAASSEKSTIDASALAVTGDGALALTGDSTVDSVVALIDDSAPALLSPASPVVHVIQDPDHSYSTIVKPAVKRKQSETSSYEDNDGDDTVVVKRSKYLERRKKNNIASKRSRETRKNKFVEMDEQSLQLERANEELKARIKELESLTKRMKEALVAKLSTTQ